MSFSNFTSLPPDEEQQFVVFERQSVESSKKAITLGIISGGILGLFLIVLYFASDPPKAMHTDALDDDDMTEEEEAPSKKAAPTPDPTPDPAPSEGSEGTEGGEGAEGATGAAPAAEGGGEAAVEAPKPPPGATKAPPTALTK